MAQQLVSSPAATTMSSAASSSSSSRPSLGSRTSTAGSSLFGEFEDAVAKGRRARLDDDGQQVDSAVHFEQTRDALVEAIDRASGSVRNLSAFNDAHHKIGTPTVTGEDDDELRILDYKRELGHHTSGALSVATLNELLRRRLDGALSYLSALRARANDTKSRVLVTGDLNAGKSTLVNALLGSELLPSDQQPCTGVFCEVLDAATHNKGAEALHAVRDVARYDANDASTFDELPLDMLNEVVQDGAELEGYQFVKAFVHDGRDDREASFIANPLVSMSLIDAPGLNRDTLSTTALLARQAEIDVVVFVVSAENHFTLSAKEFLFAAAQDKAHVFVVVNKWQQIRDKHRCVRIVGDQIKKVSPRTWDDRRRLVHFVDAQDALSAGSSDFERLEQALRSFVLLSRAQSKLLPAQHYVLAVLRDLRLLALHNSQECARVLEETLAKLEHALAHHSALSKRRDALFDALDALEDDAVASTKAVVHERLARALSSVSSGAVPARKDEDVLRAPDSVSGAVAIPPYPGVLASWSWAHDVRQALVRALELSIRDAEDAARARTAATVTSIQLDVPTAMLASADAKEVISSEPTSEARTFRPEVMFRQRRARQGRLALQGMGIGLGLGTTGKGIGAWRVADFDVSVVDVVDVERLSSLLRGHRAKVDEAEAEASTESALTTLTLGVGAVTAIGTRAIGTKSLLDGIARISDVLGNPAARRWVAPIVGVITVGLAAYVVVDLPHAIPRNVGRKLERALAAQSPSSPGFAVAHAERVANETRRVLRLAGWDTRERFVARLDDAAKDRARLEEAADADKHTLAWLADFERTVEAQRESVSAVDVV